MKTNKISLLRNITLEDFMSLSKWLTKSGKYNISNLLEQHITHSLGKLSLSNIFIFFLGSDWSSRNYNLRLSFRPMKVCLELFIFNSLRLNNFNRLFPGIEMYMIWKWDSEMSIMWVWVIEKDMQFQQSQVDIQKLLNKDIKKQKMFLKQLKNSSMPSTNFACMDLLLR